ncbi:Uncharacterised protein [uncultured archaeon]|nr:Uncharacterised protein [uncultured archaeon]
MAWESAEQTWYCPFCQQQTIKVIFRPSRKQVTRSKALVKKNPSLTILTDKCSNCGKTKEEIEPQLMY